MIEFKEYLKITKTGKQAQGRIRGILRGGYVQDGKFHAPASVAAGIIVDKIENVRGLEYAPYDSVVA